MNTRKYLLLFLVILFYQSLSYGQVTCNNNTFVSLDLNGEHYINPESILEGDYSSYDTLWTVPDIFTCDDIGAPAGITVFGIDQNGVEHTCWTEITVDDLMPPVAIGETEIHISLNGQPSIMITPDLIDDGSYDNCSDITMEVLPNIFDCNSSNPTLTTLTVTDAYGNSNQVISYVYIDDIPTGELVCNNFDFIYVGDGPVEITIEDLLTSGSSSCSSEYAFNISSVNGPVPSDSIFTDAHLGFTYTVTVLDWNTGETCSFDFVVIDGNVNYNICVNNFKGEGIQDVELTSGIFTDETGCAEIPLNYQSEIFPAKSDLQETGVDLVDQAILYDDVLGVIVFEPEQKIAGNVNYENGVTSLDRVLIEKMLLGEYDFQEIWKFIPQDSEFPNGVPDLVEIPLILGNKFDYNITAIKMGDVDASYAEFIPVTSKSNLQIKDVVLNKGELYTIPVSYESSMLLSVIQLSLNQSEMYEITEVNSTSDDIQFELVEDNDQGVVHINWIGEVGSTLENGVEFNENESFMEITIKANENSILSISGFDLSQNNYSKLKQSGNIETDYLKIEFTDLITVPVHEEELSDPISMYPNPATDKTILKLENFDAALQWNYEINNINGQTIASNNIETELIEIDLSMLHPGVYFIKVQNNINNVLVKKLIIE